MYTIRIEHPVFDFEAWKRVFDSDPAGREKFGVRQYRISRAIDDPNVVMIDLDFDTPGEAEEMLAALRVLWERATGTLVSSPRARIVEAIETR